MGVGAEPVGCRGPLQALLHVHFDDDFVIVKQKIGTDQNDGQENQEEQANYSALVLLQTLPGEIEGTSLLADDGFITLCHIISPTLSQDFL